jgi:hypothetical protein
LIPVIQSPEIKMSFFKDIPIIVLYSQISEGSLKTPVSDHLKTSFSDTLKGWKGDALETSGSSAVLSGASISIKKES